MGYKLLQGKGRERFMIELKFLDVLFSELSEQDNFVKNWNNNLRLTLY